MTSADVSERTQTAEGASSVPPPNRHRAALEVAERLGLPLLFLALVVVFSVLRPETFPTLANARTIASSQAVMAVSALALLFPLLAGRFDISVGANVGIASIATAAAMSSHHLSVAIAAGIGVLCGCLIGLVNGVLIAYFGIDSIICTIGVATVLGGVVFAYTDGIPVSTGISPTLTNLSIQRVAGIPALFVIMVVLALTVWAVMARFTFGRQLAAIGSNEVAARLTGLPIRRLVLLSFVCSGLLSGGAGVMLVAAQGNGNPQVGGIAFLLPALAAVFLGATTIFPGRYNVPGTVIAILFVGTAVSGLTLMGAQTWITDAFNGTAVIVAVGAAAAFRRRRTGQQALGH